MSTPETTSPRFQFIDSMVKKRVPGNITLWTAAELRTAMKADPGRTPHFFEILRGGYTKPYFDSDAYYKQPPSESERERVFQCFKDVLLELLNGAPGFLADRLVFGERHGIDPKHPEKPHKISFRAYLPGFKVQYPQLANLIQQRGLHGDTEGLLDISVYKESEQLMACMGCCKGTVPKPGQGILWDSRILRPLGPKQKIEAYLVQHLAGDKTELVLPDLTPQPEPPLPPEATIQAPHDETQQTDIDMDYVRDVTALLKQHRWEGYAQWIDYGFALKNYGGERLKAVWKDCAKVSSDYDEEVADKKWAGFCQPDSNFSGKKISFGTICSHAKEDDPEGYALKKLAGRSVQHRIRFALQTGGSHVAMAKVLCAVLGEKYKATSATKGRVWFRFDGTRWKSHDDGQVLRDLTDVVYPLFEKEVLQSNRFLRFQLKISGRKNSWKKRRTLCAKVANSLLDSNYRRSIIKEFAPLVQDRNFEARLDSNFKLLGFEDCVYDLATKEARAGRPEDYLTKSVGYPYPKESRGCEADIEDFLVKILPDPEVRNYLLDLLAQKLGGACVKRVCIHTGIGGDNGKTTLFDFLPEAMGEYG